MRNQINYYLIFILLIGIVISVNGNPTICPFITPLHDLPPGTEFVCPYSAIPAPLSPSLDDRVQECLAPFSNPTVTMPVGQESHCPYIPFDNMDGLEGNTTSLEQFISQCSNNLTLPQGIYPSAYLTINCSESSTVYIRASEPGSVILQAAYGWSMTFQSISVVFENITLDGMGTENSLFLDPVRSTNLTFRNCRIINYAGTIKPVIEMDICDDKVGLIVVNSLFQRIPGTSISAIALAYMTIVNNTWDRCGGATQDAVYLKGNWVSRDIYEFRLNSLWAVKDLQPKTCVYDFIDSPNFRCSSGKLLCYDEFSTRSLNLCPLELSVPEDPNSELVFASYCRIYSPCRCAPIDFSIPFTNITVTYYIGNWLLHSPSSPTTPIVIPCIDGETRDLLLNLDPILPLYSFADWSPPFNNHNFTVYTDGVAGSCPCPNSPNITTANLTEFCNYKIVDDEQTTKATCENGIVSCFGSEYPGDPCTIITNASQYYPLISYFGYKNCNISETLSPNIFYVGYINASDIPIYNGTVPPGYVLNISLVCGLGNDTKVIASSLKPCDIVYPCRCSNTSIPVPISNLTIPISNATNVTIFNMSTTTTTPTPVTTTTAIPGLPISDPSLNTTSNIPPEITNSTELDPLNPTYPIHAGNPFKINCAQLYCMPDGTIQCDCGASSLSLALGYTIVPNATAFHIDNIQEDAILEISDNRAQQLPVAVHIERIYWEGIVAYSNYELGFYDYKGPCREILRQNNQLLEGTEHDCVWGPFDYWNMQFCDNNCPQYLQSANVAAAKSSACLVDKGVLDSDVLLYVLKFHTIQDAIDNCKRNTIIIVASDSPYDEVLTVEKTNFILISYDEAAIVGASHYLEGWNITLRGVTWIHPSSREDSIFRFKRGGAPGLSILNCRFLGDKNEDGGIINSRSEIRPKLTVFQALFGGAPPPSDVGAFIGNYFTFKYNYVYAFKANVIELFGSYLDVSSNTFEYIQGGCIHLTHYDLLLRVDENIFLECHGAKFTNGATIVHIRTFTNTEHCYKHPEQCSIFHNRQHALSTPVDYSDTCFFFENLKMNLTRIAHNMCGSAQYGMKFKGGTSVRTSADFQAIQMSNSLVRPSENRIQPQSGFDFVIMDFSKTSDLITVNAPPADLLNFQDFVAPVASNAFVYTQCNYPCAGHRVTGCVINKNYDLSLTEGYGITKFNNWTESMKYCSPPNVAIPTVYVTAFNGSRHSRERINITRTMFWIGSAKLESRIPMKCCELVNVTCLHEIIDDIQSASNRSVYIRPVTLEETFVNVSAYLNGTIDILELFNITEIVLNCSTRNSNSTPNYNAFYSIFSTCTEFQYSEPLGTCFYTLGLAYLNSYVPQINLIDPFSTCNFDTLYIYGPSQLCYFQTIKKYADLIYSFVVYDFQHPGSIVPILAPFSTIIPSINTTSSNTSNTNISVNTTLLNTTYIGINSTSNITTPSIVVPVGYNIDLFSVCLPVSPLSLADLIGCIDPINSTDTGAGCTCLYNPNASCYLPVVHGSNLLYVNHYISYVEFYVEIDFDGSAVNHFFTANPVQYINYTGCIFDGRNITNAGSTEALYFQIGVSGDTRHKTPGTQSGTNEIRRKDTSYIRISGCVIKNYARFDALGYNDVEYFEVFVPPPPTNVIDPLNPNDPNNVPYNENEDPTELNADFEKIHYDANGVPYETDVGAVLNGPYRPNDLKWLNNTIDFLGNPQPGPSSFNRRPTNGVKVLLSNDYFTFVPSTGAYNDPTKPIRWNPGRAETLYNASNWPSIQGLRIEFVNIKSKSTTAEIRDNLFEEMAGRSLEIENAVNWVVFNNTFRNVGGKNPGEIAIVYITGNQFNSGYQIFANNSHSQKHRVFFDQTNSGSAPAYLTTFYIRSQVEKVGTFVVENCTCDASLPICMRFETLPYRNLMKTMPPYPKRVVYWFDLFTPLREVCLNGNQNASGWWHDLVFGPPYKDFFHDRASGRDSKQYLTCDKCCGVGVPTQCWVQKNNASIVPTNPWFGKYLFTDISQALIHCNASTRIVNVVQPHPFDLYFSKIVANTNNITLNCVGDARIVGSNHNLVGSNLAIRNCVFIHSGNNGPTFSNNPHINTCFGPISFRNNTFLGSKTKQPIMNMTASLGFNIQDCEFSGYSGKQGIILNGCVCLLTNTTTMLKNLTGTFNYVPDNSTLVPQTVIPPPAIVVPQWRSLLPPFNNISGELLSSAQSVGEVTSIQSPVFTPQPNAVSLSNAVVPINSNIIFMSNTFRGFNGEVVRLSRIYSAFFSNNFFYDSGGCVNDNNVLASVYIRLCPNSTGSFEFSGNVHNQTRKCARNDYRRGCGYTTAYRLQNVSIYHSSLIIQNNRVEEGVGIGLLMDNWHNAAVSAIPIGVTASCPSADLQCPLRRLSTSTTSTVGINHKSNGLWHDLVAYDSICMPTQILEYQYCDDGCPRSQTDVAAFGIFIILFVLVLYFAWVCCFENRRNEFRSVNIPELDTDVMINNRDEILVQGARFDDVIGNSEAQNTIASSIDWSF